MLNYMRRIALRARGVRLKHDDGKGEYTLRGNNSTYLEYLYRSWQNDPSSVDPSWATYFESIRDPLEYSYTVSHDKKMGPTLRVTSSASIVPAKLSTPDLRDPFLGKERARKMSMSEQLGDRFVTGALDLSSTIRAYQSRGHLIADIDPLGIQNSESAKLQGTDNLPPAIVVRSHLKAITDADMNREFPLARHQTRIAGDKNTLTLREIITRLNKIYCGHLGLEYTYIHDTNMLDWLREKFEVPGAWNLIEEHRKWIWIDIMRAVTFENFLARKYGSEKRFGLEGCEAFIPSMVQCLETSAEKGVESVVIGMAHRGRLSTLVNVLSRPMHMLFVHFNPLLPLEGFGSGDVKYHLGLNTRKVLERSKKTITLALLANSSHLEAVNPMVIGRVRAEQVAKGDSKYGTKSLPILVHGDASFSGQGIVYETMTLTNLPEYTTGGVIHLVINNQIGFTTDPRYSRSSAHCTDVARVVNAPIFHVHGDDPDLVVYCSKVASEYRAEFHNDVVVDIVGYRRNGHNEMDEPMLTQPLMYKRIKGHPNVLKIYTDKLLKDGVITESFVKEETDKYLSYCEEEFAKAQTMSSMQVSDWHDVPWDDFFAKQSPDNPIPSTGIEISDVEDMCEKISRTPEGIDAHGQVSRMNTKRAGLLKDSSIDWGMGESIAYLSLLKDGHHVRLSGEDVERGTFSHRMHIIHDQNRDLTWKNILNDVYPNQGLYTVSNSSLSEYGVCGFELGYATYDHKTLTLWEAQFGDFVNNAQTILDTMMSAGEVKWGRQVGLVLLLPHGMEGQGPEHSSARLERFLQLCDDDPTHLPGSGNVSSDIEQIMTRQLFDINWIVCNLTTPANFFHVIRRQILMPFRKPLVIMTPKSLLRHPMVISKFEELGPNASFKPLLPDSTANAESVKRVLICSGKVYYELLSERNEKNLKDDIAIVRIEQICPFPYDSLAREIANYKNPEIVWAQEEHRNQGAFSYVRERIALALKKPLQEVKYVGRPPSASTATGSKIIYKTEYSEFMKNAMTLNK